jgi:hypothetical protein
MAVVVIMVKKNNFKQLLIQIQKNLVTINYFLGEYKGPGRGNDDGRVNKFLKKQGHICLSNRDFSLREYTITIKKYIYKKLKKKYKIN